MMNAGSVGWLRAIGNDDFFGPELRASAKESIEILVFPTSCPGIVVKLAFSPIEFVGVNLSASVFVNLLGNNCMQHLVIDHVFEEPGGNKWRIQQGMDTDDFVLLLNRSEDKIFFWGASPSAAPDDLVALKRITKVFNVQLVEYRFEVKILTFGGKKELPLDGKPFK
jgi:hypothetical protein